MNLKLFKILNFLTIITSPLHALAIVTLPEEIRPSTLPTKQILTTSSDIPVEHQIQSIIGNFISTAMYLTGGIAVIVLIIAGIRYAISGGEEDQINKAKDTIKWVVGGLLILFLALAIIKFVVQISVGVTDL